MEIDAGSPCDNMLHFDDITIILETEEQVRIDFDFNEAMTHMTNRGWLVNSVKTQEPTQMVTFSE